MEDLKGIIDNAQTDEQLNIIQEQYTDWIKTIDEPVIKWIFYKNGIVAINNKRRLISKDPFYKMIPVETTENMVINGFKLYNYSEIIDGLLFSRDEFAREFDVWSNSRTLEWNDFFKEFIAISCRDWGLKDSNGDRIYADDVVDSKNITFVPFLFKLLHDNAMALYQLPYPHDFLLRTTKFSSPNACVRLSNFLAHCLSLKMAMYAQVHKKRVLNDEEDDDGKKARMV